MTRLRKGRVRIKRGTLKQFKDLPKDKQKIFLLIKKIIVNEVKENVKVYVFGSFLWGFWDKYSDYDICLISNYNNISELKKTIEKIIAVKVDILKSLKPPTPAVEITTNVIC